jgi:hypothetical protein
MFSTSLFREIPILTDTHHVESGSFGASNETGVTYDFEGFTDSTLRSNGCVAGVGVEDVCRALVAAVCVFVSV